MNQRKGGGNAGPRQRSGHYGTSRTDAAADYGFDKKQQSFSQVAAPFNFVPVSRFVYRPEWGEAISHDLPFEDGYCGRIDIELEAHTPLCVGAERPEPSGDGWTVVPFAHLIEPCGRRRHIIPGSSLKGMIRNVVEIAAFGKLSYVDDLRLSVRDLTPGGAFYTRQVTEMVDANGGKAAIARVRSGFLYRAQDESGAVAYRVRHCRYARIDYQKLPNAKRRDGKPLLPRQFDREAAKREGYLKCSYAPPRAKRCPSNSRRTVATLHLEVDSLRRRGEARAGDRDGFLVCTSHVGAKHRQFVFDEPGKDACDLKVPEPAWSAFLAAHPQKHKTPKGMAFTPWGNWKLLLDRREVGPDSNCEPGIPVFYLADGTGEILRLGIAQMPKLGYDYTIGEMVLHSSGDHASPQYDLAEAMFGTVRRNEAHHVKNLKGRISFGTARPADGRSPSVTEPMVLNGPKPTYYPAYVEQDRQPGAATDYATYFAPEDGERPLPEIRGWKRYWSKGEVQGTRTPTNSKALSSKLETFPKGARFRFSILVHNVRKVELGALAWALAFGEPVGAPAGRRAHRHGLGMGKPYGFGAVTLKVVGGALTANKPAADEAAFREDVFRDGKMIALLDTARENNFEPTMEAAYRQAATAHDGGANAAPGASWSQSEQLAALRNLAAAERPTQQMAPPKSPKYTAPYMALCTDKDRRFNHFINAKTNRSVLEKAGAAAPAPERAVFPRGRCETIPAKPLSPDWLRKSLQGDAPEESD